MDPRNPALTVAVILLALGTAYCLARRHGAPPAQGRFASLDGLRGYTAMFVFLHHGYIWFSYLRTDQWRPAPSHLYMHLGQSSVAFFFMITAFLFFNKLLSVRGESMDWSRYFVSRLMRLGPMYFFALAVLLIIVGIETGWTLSDTLLALIADIGKWLAFSIREPDINGMKDTSVILAGVTWTLPYEWIFYFSLPVFALALRIKPPLTVLLLACCGIAFAVAWGPHRQQHFMSFAAGMLVAVLSHVPTFVKFAEGRLASCIAIAALVVAVVMFPSLYSSGPLPLLLLTIAFAILACGNSLWGLLTNSVSRTLGEMAYSIYLLHGIVLFVAIRFVIGTEEAAQMSSTAHSAFLLIITPIIVVLSHFTFSLVEKPGMGGTATIMRWINRARIRRQMAV